MKEALKKVLKKYKVKAEFYDEIIEKTLQAMQRPMEVRHVTMTEPKPGGKTTSNWLGYMKLSLRFPIGATGWINHDNVPFTLIKDQLDGKYRIIALPQRGSKENPTYHPTMRGFNIDAVIYTAARKLYPILHEKYLESGKPDEVFSFMAVKGMFFQPDSTDMSWVLTKTDEVTVSE